MTAPATPADLARAIVRGTLDDDPVQMHGAIVAVLETYADPETRQTLFQTALAHLADHPRHYTLAAAAIRHHLTIYRDTEASAHDPGPT